MNLSRPPSTNQLRVAVPFLIGCLLASGASAQEAARSGARHVKDGNRLLKEGKYAEALGEYDQAKADLPDSPEVAYDRGIALYRLNEFAKAESAFQDALKPGRPELEARAKYNLGRCAHASGLAKKDELQVAINELSRAIRFYKDALRLHPKDADAEGNQAAAERLMAFLETKLKEQQEQKKNPSSQPQDRSTSQPQSEQPASQPSSQPTSQAGEHEGDQEKDRDEQGQKQQDQTDEKDRKQEQANKGQGDAREGQSGEETKEGEEKDRQLKAREVEPMLQEARDAERKRREAKRREMLRLRGRTPVRKDW